jgi:hypothetical protein
MRCITRAVEPCFREHGRLSPQMGTPLVIWLIGTTRRLRVDNSEDVFLPAEVTRYLEITSQYYSYIYGDFTICPIEHDRPGYMRSVCVANSTNLVVQSVTNARPPFRVLSTWFHDYEHTGPAEGGPVGLSCDADVSAAQNSMFQLEVGAVQLHDGKGSVVWDSQAYPEWSVELKRAERWGPRGRFLLFVVTANHLAGSGGGDSVFLYVCRGNQLSQALWAKKEYGAEVQTVDFGLSIKSGAWGPRDPHCCPSFERVEQFTWNERAKRFVRTSSRVTQVER